MPREKGRKVIASNRKARHDYTILDTFEAGIALIGTEVKSLRAGPASLVDAFAQEKDGEIFLHGAAHPGVRAGHLDQPRAAPHPQAAAASAPRSTG